MADFLIDSLRGGLNLDDPPSALAKDACTVANNVEFFLSTLGERRKGCEGIDLPAALVADPDMEAVTYKYRHLPTNDEGDAELWVLAQKLDGTAARLFRNALGVWTEVTMTDSPVASGLIEMRMQSLHGKLFAAYPSAVDRLHVWDGTSFRRAGLAEPVAPVVINAAVADYSEVVLADLPTGYWRLNEASGAFADSSGNGVTLTPAGATGITYSVSGVFSDDGIALVQVHDRITGASFPQTWNAGVSAGSVEFWIKISAATLASGQVFEAVIDGGASGGSLDFPAIGIHIVGGQAYPSFRDTVFVSPSYVYNYQDAGVALTVDVNHHVVASVSAAGVITWYVDGAAAGTVPLTGAIRNLGGSTFGFTGLSAGGGDSRLIASLLDEVAMYNAELTQTQVSNHFSNEGSFSGTRYYRVRYTTQSGGVTLRRSEPSDSTTFVPDGLHSGAQIARPALLSEGETHWEIEASLDNTTFYVISTQLVATTSYTDTDADGSGYSAFALSEDIGTYGLIPSVRLLSVDEDRLIVGGSFETEADDSKLRWTPVGNDPSPGQDERLNDTTDPELDLDGREGGNLADLSRALNGTLFAFKAGHIYKVLRTGQLVGAYEAIVVTKARGAIARSLIEAADQGGRPALYFTDPLVGPMRLGSEGLQQCGADIRPLWARVNIDASRAVHGVYYSSKLQIHWWIAVDGADHPNWKIVLQTNEIRSTPELGARRGWSVVPSPARIADAYCSCMFAANVESTDPRERRLVPYIGKEQWTV